MTWAGRIFNLLLERTHCSLPTRQTQSEQTCTIHKMIFNVKIEHCHAAVIFLITYIYLSIWCSISGCWREFETLNMSYKDSKLILLINFCILGIANFAWHHTHRFYHLLALITLLSNKTRRKQNFTSDLKTKKSKMEDGLHVHYRHP